MVLIAFIIYKYYYINKRILQKAFDLNCSAWEGGS